MGQNNTRDHTHQRFEPFLGLDWPLQYHTFLRNIAALITASTVELCYSSLFPSRQSLYIYQKYSLIDNLNSQSKERCSTKSQCLELSTLSLRILLLALCLLRCFCLEVYSILTYTFLVFNLCLRQNIKCKNHRPIQNHYSRDKATSIPWMCRIV